MAKITYEYLGCELVDCKDGLDKVFNDGTIRKGKYQSVWHEGSEECPKKQVNERISILERITNDFGNKKYRNIKIV